MRSFNVIISRDGVHENILKIKPPIIFNNENVNELMIAFHKAMPIVEQELKRE